MGFDYRQYQLNLAQARRAQEAQELNLSWADVVFDPEKHPRLAGKFTVSHGKEGGRRVATLKPKDASHPLAEIQVRKGDGGLRVDSKSKSTRVTGATISQVRYHGTGMSPDQAAHVIGQLHNNPDAVRSIADEKVLESQVGPVGPDISGLKDADGLTKAVLDKNYARVTAGQPAMKPGAERQAHDDTYRAKRAQGHSRESAAKHASVAADLAKSEYDRATRIYVKANGPGPKEGPLYSGGHNIQFPGKK